MRNTLHPDRAFVHVDELTRQVQADPRSRHIVLVTGKETVKDGSNIFRRNTFAIIFDRKLDLISFIFQMDRDVPPSSVNLNALDKRLARIFSILSLSTHILTEGQSCSNVKCICLVAAIVSK